jgi:hypothetical protein
MRRSYLCVRSSSYRTCAFKLTMILPRTGYRDPYETWSSLLSPEIIDRAGPAWGLDEEGEFRGAYRPTGQPGLWFATGDFAHSRWGSKQLVSWIMSRCSNGPNLAIC